MNAFEDINSWKYLDVLQVFEPKQLSLEFFIYKAEGAPFDKWYKVNFEHYSSCLLLDESQVDLNGPEEGIGRLFGIYTKSGYLDYIVDNSIDSSPSDGSWLPLKHYCFYGLNLIVHVISRCEPQLTLLTEQDAEAIMDKRSS